MSDPQYEKTVLTSSIIGWSVLFITIIASATWYTSKGTGKISNNQQSEDKITVIGEAMTSAFGPNWPYVILVIVISITLCLGSIYLASQNNQISFTVNDQLASRFNWIFLGFTIVFSIFVIVLGVKQWMLYKNEQTNGNIPNYIPNIQQKSQINQILVVVVLGLIAIIGGGFGVWKVFFKK